MEEKEKGKAKAKEYYEALQIVLGTIVVVILLFTFVFRLNVVRGASMEPTLQEHDLLFVMSAPLCGAYEPGDIVILRKESLQFSPIVKRVIAVGGQVVDIDFGTGSVYVDGQRLQEDYVSEPTYREEGMEFPLKVPEGSVFVMGDNRNHSTDSRDTRLGTIDTRYLFGKAKLLLFPGASEESGVREYRRIGVVD